MAGNSRNAEQVRLEIEAEREQLTGAVDSLRSGISEAANIGTKLRAKLPVVAAGAVGVGFVFAFHGRGGGTAVSVSAAARASAY